MLKYPQIDPVIFTLGPIQPRWYGMMYLLGFLYTYYLLKKHSKWIGFPEDKTDSVLAALVLGLIITARAVYVIFYNLKGTWESMTEPFSRAGATTWDILMGLIEPIAIWHGGLAFHGGLLGTIFGCLYVCRKYNVRFTRLADVLALATPVGLGLGRIANFINNELWGRVTDVPWAFVFPGEAAGPHPRHPSQLYESFFEGLVLFVILQVVWRLKPRVGIVAGVFCVGYAIFRTGIENFREPDAQVGFLFGGLTMGQLLSFAVFVYGVFLIRLAMTRGEAHDTPAPVAAEVAVKKRKKK